MAKPRKKTSRQPAAPPPPAPARNVDLVTLLTLAGMVGALLVSFASWQKIGYIAERLGDRLERIETRVSEMVESSATAPQAPPARQPRRGPDPDRVYDIRTAGAPARGPAGAPVTIVEFSDFQ